MQGKKLKNAGRKVKLKADDLRKVELLRKEYGLSLTQCCLWLEKRRGVCMSRTGLYLRLQKLQER